MEKTIRELTGDLLAAPSACKEIKDAAQNYLDAVGTEDARIFFDAKRIQEQPVWEGYDQLTELFKEDACELLEGNCELDEIMERFQEQREEVFGKMHNE